MTTDELLFLPPDDIDYASLGDQRLLSLATQRDEPFIATNALTELRMRSAEEARVAARLLVRDQSTDRHLRALAMTTLFDRDAANELPLLIETVSTTTDPEILSAAVDGVEQEWTTLSGAAAHDLVEALVRQLHVAQPDQFTDTAQWNDFLARYSPAAKR